MSSRLAEIVWALLGLLLSTACGQLVLLLARLLTRGRRVEEAPVRPARVREQSSRLRPAGFAPPVGTFSGTFSDVARPFGGEPAHPLSPVGRLRGQMVVTVDGEGLGSLPADELGQHTLAVLAEHAQRARRSGPAMV